MAVRQDKVQIDISFITDESKAYAKLINQNKTFVDDLKKAKKAGQDFTATINQMVASGQSLSKLDLSKIAPDQLKVRASQLKKALDFIPSSSAQARVLQTELKAINDQLATNAATTKGMVAGAPQAFNALTAGARGFTMALGWVAVAIAAIQTGINALKGLFSVGQDAEALQNKMQAVFGESGKTVEEFAEKNAKAIGLSRREYKSLATDVGDLLTPMGFTQKAAAEMSLELVNQAGVLSQWTKGKVSTTEATEILNKALLGERDALNRLGIDVKDSTIQNELKRQGLDKLTGNELKQAEALATLKIITEQSSNANNAFADSTDNLQQRKAKLRARVSELVDKLGTSLIPVFNKVMEVLIPVVEWTIEFGSSLANAWKKAETFRAIVAGQFQAIGVIISRTAQGIAGVSEGFVNLFSGEFSKAFDSFSGAWNKLNPVGTGRAMAEGWANGWNSVKHPEATIQADIPGAQKEGEKLASAMTDSIDKRMQDLKANHKKSAKELSDATKGALELGLKQVEANALRRETIAEGERLAGVKKEREYEAELLQIQKDRLEQSIEAYRKYGKDASVEALKLKNELAKLIADTTLTKVPEAQAIGARATGPVTSDNTAQRLGIAGFNQEVTITSLQNKLDATLKAEQDFEILRMEMKRDFLQEEIDILRQSSQPQTEAIKKREEAKKQIEEEIGLQRLENQRRLEELQSQVYQTGLQTTGEIFSAAAELLAKDEKSKAKHAETIKALQKANIQVNLIAEVSGIFANAQKSPVAQLLGPIAGNILAGVQAGIATARAVVAMNKIEAQKFERGRLLQFARGKAGIFGGNLHLHGGTHLYGTDGTHIEVERDEAFAVVNRKNTPMLRMLSRINAAGGHGDPYFETGGLTRANTTPGFSISDTQAAPADNRSLAMLATEFAGFRNEVRTWQRNLKVYQVYSEAQATGIKASTIYNEAAM